MRPEIRRPLTAVVFMLAAAVLITLCSMLFAAPGAVLAVDRPLHHWLITHREPMLTTAATALTSVGTSATVLPVLVVAALLLSTGDLRRRLLVSAGVLVVAVAGLLCRLGLSVVIGRARPPMADWAGKAAGFAFPSGHSADGVLLAGLLGWLLLSRVHARWARIALAVLLAGYALAMGATRMYLGVHWPLDVLGGWAFGCLWLSGAALLVMALRRRPASPAVSEDAAPR